MEFMVVSVIILYILSTAGYTAYLLAQKKYLHKIGYYLLFSGFLLHCIAIGYGYSGYFAGKAGYIPVHDLHDTLSVAGWAIAGVFLLLRYKYRLKILGVFAAALAAIVMITASYLLPNNVGEINTLFNSVWVVVHVVFIFIGEAALAMAFGVGLLYLIQERAIKTKKHGFFYKRLPSLDLLDNTGYTCIVVGFTMLTIGLILGIVYAKLIGGRFWSWTLKEVWSGITWLVYAVLLHQRFAMGWRGRRAAIMCSIGFIILLFTFFGVNFLLDTHHGEFFQVVK